MFSEHKSYHRLFLYFVAFISIIATLMFIFQYERNDKELIEVADGQNIKELGEIAELLKVYTVYDQDGQVKMIRLGRENDGGYVVPEIALRKADALIGYGIADDYSFEEQFSDKYNKPSFGFDCGISGVKSKNKLFTFVQECIANDNFLYSDHKSSNAISSFTQQVQKLNLHDKKLFIKMDIEGAEYDAFEDLLKHSSNITGIVLEIHFSEMEQTTKALRLLTKIQKSFLLIHVHGNNCMTKRFTSKSSLGYIPKVLELTYINKSLVNESHISNLQKHPTDIDMPNCSTLSDTDFEIIVQNK